MRRFSQILVRSAVLALVAGAPGGALADASAADPATSPPALDGLTSFAEVEGPRGKFTTAIVSLADGRATLVQQHPARRTELLAIGEAAFTRAAAGPFEPAPAGMAGFVHGHDVPRLAQAELRRLAGGGRPERIELPPAPATGGSAVTIELGDWRTVAGFDFPFAATFVHGGERFAYRYLWILPFRPAPGSPLFDAANGARDPAALFERLGDHGELVWAHEEGMAAHRASDAGRLVAGAAERSTISGRGRLSETTRDETEARMRDYLGSIRFSRYEDTAVPVVAVSADGTLGWLACEMEAEGVRTAAGKSEPLAYAFSWVELYARPPVGSESVLRWRSIGNASSQRP